MASLTKAIQFCNHINIKNVQLQTLIVHNLENELNFPILKLQKHWVKNLTSYMGRIGYKDSSVWTRVYLSLFAASILTER